MYFVNLQIVLNKGHVIIADTIKTLVGTAVAQWLRCFATNRKVAGSIPAGVSGFFIDVKSFRSHYGPGVHSASNRNEYQEYFLWDKGGLCVRLTTYHQPVPLSRNLGTLTSWNRLGHSSPVTGLIKTLEWLRESTKNIVISGFRREVGENCILLGSYATSSGNSLPTFRDNVSVPSCRVSNPRTTSVVASCHSASRTQDPQI